MQCRLSNLRFHHLWTNQGGFNERSLESITCTVRILRVSHPAETELFCFNFFNLFFIFNGLECVGHSFAYVAHIIFLTDVWIRTQRAAAP